MKLPRKGILIRLAIYLPLIGGLLVWRACYFEREEVIQPAPQGPSHGPIRTITVEEARKLGIDVPEKPTTDDTKQPE